MRLKGINFLNPYSNKWGKIRSLLTKLVSSQVNILKTNTFLGGCFWYIEIKILNYINQFQMSGITKI